MITEGDLKMSICIFCLTLGNKKNPISFLPLPVIHPSISSMIITRTSITSGITRSLDLPVTEEQLDLYYNGGALLQNAFPHLSPSEREFIKTGITDEEWNAAFSFPDSDEDDEEYEDDDIDPEGRFELAIS